MDTLLKVSMSVLGPSARGVPQTPPQPSRRPPLTDLSNVGTSPEWCRGGEGRRTAERRGAEPHPSDTPPTPMTNLKLLTNIAASQQAGSRKALFGSDANRETFSLENIPTESIIFKNEKSDCFGTLKTENIIFKEEKWQDVPVPVKLTPRDSENVPPVTPRNSENILQPGTPSESFSTPVSHYHSVFDTPGSGRARIVHVTPKLRWKKHASDVLPLPRTCPGSGGSLACHPSPAAEPFATPSSFKSRKEKSLSVLCARFLEIYPLDVDGKDMLLSLDETAVLLGTERRRIYDIVNVLESLHFSVKIEKNRYAWVGRRHLAVTLGRLKGMALQLDLPQHLRAALQATDLAALEPPPPPPAGAALRRNASEPALASGGLLLADGAAEGCAGSPCLTPLLETPQKTPRTPQLDADCLTPRDRGDRTLGVLTQKFVMLLLVSDRPWLSQDVLARVLLGQDGLSPDGQHKAKVRRLYDIANILQSVGLVGKETNAACRRPMFSYTGLKVDPISVDPDTQRSRHSLIQTTPLSRKPTAKPAALSAHGTPQGGRSGASTPEGSTTPRSLSRPPSLDDICRVTALERHRLFEQAIDGSRGKSVLKRRLAEVQRAQDEVKRAPPPLPPARPGELSPAQHSQLRGLGVKRILIRSGDGSTQEICVRDAARPPPGAGDGDGPPGSRLEAALRGAWIAGGPAVTPRPPRALVPRQTQSQQVVAYQLVPVVRTVTNGLVTPDNGEQLPVPILYDERTVLALPEGAALESAVLAAPAVVTPVSVPTATPESLLTPGTMTLVREAVSSGTIKTVCNMALTPDSGATPAALETAAARPVRSRPASRASRRLQME